MSVPIPRLLAALLGALAIFGATWLITPSEAVLTLPDPGAEIRLDATPTIRFSKPISRRALLLTLEPALDGVWQFEDAVIPNHGYRSARFIPDRPFRPHTTYTIRLATRGARPAPLTPRAAQWSFTTADLPNLAAVMPSDQSTDQSLTTAPRITLDRPVEHWVELTARVEPEATVTVTPTSDRTVFTIEPATAWLAGTTYTLIVEQSYVARDTIVDAIVERADPAVLYRGTFTTARPPLLVSAEPAGPSTPRTASVALHFTESLESESVRKNFRFEPERAGVLSLESDNRVVRWQPDEPLAVDTAYTAHLAAGTRTRAGASLADAVVWTFRTAGAVHLTHTLPKDNATGVNPQTTLELTFDQPVDHAAAEARVRLDPAIGVTAAWEGQTLRLRPRVPLAAGERYRLTVEAGIPGEWGSPSSSATLLTFTTQLPVTLLDVSVDLQDRPLSCEAAALKMALAAKGVNVSEAAIMARVGYDPTKRSKGRWGDPDQAFVGDIDGAQNTTGYGVYWEPIARAASAWRPAEAFTNGTAAQVAQYIAQGHPVVVWGTYGNAKPDSWTTPTGKRVRAWKGEHVRTIIGFEGPLDEPVKFILNDPYTGRISWSRKTFEQNWAAFGNAGVVVR